jgi:hypothetical protein
MAKQIFFGIHGGNIYLNYRGQHYTNDKNSVKILKHASLNDPKHKLLGSIDSAVNFMAEDLRTNRPTTFLISEDFIDYFGHIKETICSYFNKATVKHYIKP